MNVKKILLSLLVFASAKLIAQPAVNPQTPPARTPAQVISVYGETYTSLTNVNFNPNWGQSGFGGATTFTLSGNEMRHYPNMNYQGIDIKNGVNPAINVSSLDSLHLDIWSSNCTSIDIFLVSDASGEKSIRRTLNLNSWNPIDILLSDYFTQGLPLTAIKEFKFVTVTPGSGANIYVDNIYFYTNLNLPTLSNFPNITKMVGDPNFTVATPTTNNNPASFTYTSSNTSVATINPTTGLVSLVGTPGTSIITATQPASNGFSQGTISATLTVNPAPPSVAAPTPTRTPASAIISTFSDAYTPTATMTTATWSGNTSSVIQVATNNTLKIETTNQGNPFVGFELSSGLDISNMTHMHIDVFVSGAINPGAVFIPKLSQHRAAPGSGEERAFLHTIADPAAFASGEWRQYDIPFSVFDNNLSTTAAANKNNILQLIFSFNNLSVGGPIYFDNIYFYNSALLPVDFKAFTATKANNAIQLVWEVANEVNVSGYSVERSVNGTNFSAIGFVNASSKNSYSFTDANAVSGTNFYRIKSVDKDGSVKYSSTKSVNNNGNKAEYAIYPNPASNELVLKNLVGSNSVSIIDVAGKVVLNRVNVTNNNATINITSISKGLYTVVINNGKENNTFKLVIEK